LVQLPVCVRPGVSTARCPRGLGAWTTRRYLRRTISLAQ
jgi:hypothetical protein